MLEFTTMTYLIVGNNDKNIQENIKELISKLWDKDLTEDLFNLQNPDYHLIDAREENSIGIERMKELQSEMVFTPFEEKYQIALIYDSPKLTTQAQNSILKTLEESSDTTVYILTTNNEKSLLPTILSRSRKIYIEEGEKLQTDTQDISKFLELNLVEQFQKIETLSKEKNDILNFLDQMEAHFQKILEESINNSEDSTSISQAIKLAITAKKRIKANGNKRLVLENLCLQLKDIF